MNSLIPAKTLSHGLVLISAVFLLRAHDVLAAEDVGDAQAQARDLLSGTVGGRAKVIDESPAISADGHPTPTLSPQPTLDPQEQARQLILGKPNLGRITGRAAALGPQLNETSAVSTRDDHRTYADPQESARRMILGSGVNWKTEDGTTHSDIKRVNYTVLPGVSRTIAVDHQYFDTAAGEHTTDVVRVNVDKVTCLDSRSLQTASTAAQAMPERTASPEGTASSIRSF